MDMDLSVGVKLWMGIIPLILSGCYVAVALITLWRGESTRQRLIKPYLIWGANLELASIVAFGFAAYDVPQLRGMIILPLLWFLTYGSFVAFGIGGIMSIMCWPIVAAREEEDRKLLLTSRILLIGGGANVLVLSELGGFLLHLS